MYQTKPQVSPQVPVTPQRLCVGTVWIWWHPVPCAKSEQRPARRLTIEATVRL